MKTRMLFALFSTAVLVHADNPKAPIYETTFNSANKQFVDFLNGAGIGDPGSGVSGKPADRAYVSAPKTAENISNGPVGVAREPIATVPLNAFTCVFWYYLDESGPVLQVPLNTASILFLLTEKGFEVRIENQLEQPRAYVFSPGLDGPLINWRSTKHWIFAAFSWDRETNTLTVHQGTPTAAVSLMRTMSKAAPAKPTLPRADLARFPEVIGNTYYKYDRPLAGRLDDLRFFDCVLTRAELEILRKADLANESVVLK